VYTPPASTAGAEAWVWHLAKAYANVNDYCWHQLISHWLNTHAVMEPFVIATNRQLSVTHPVHKLLQPHYRDTMNVNSSARQLLVNAGGIFETTVFPRQYAFEISSKSLRKLELHRAGSPRRPNQEVSSSNLALRA
jgi:linoleate 9S-lipoxygenase